MTEQVKESCVVCESCGSANTSITMEDELFLYGNGADQVTLTARVPVISCGECGFQRTGEGAETARHEVVCAHLGRLSPRELVELRRNYDLSQVDWARLTGFGEASIKRWERGNQIQSESADNLLRLLMLPRNAELIQRQKLASAQKRQPTFKTDLSVEARRRAAAFSLRLNPEVGAYGQRRAA